MTGVRIAAAAMAVIALATGSATAANIDEGKKVFNKCKACHSLEAGKRKVGPSLHGVFGRKAGTLEGFKYSQALKDSGITWDEGSMRRYLADPKAVVPGGRMAFAGIKKDSEMDDLIAYLKQATK